MTKVNKTFLNKNTFKKKKNSINTCRLSEPLNKGMARKSHTPKSIGFVKQEHSASIS